MGCGGDPAAWSRSSAPGYPEQPCWWYRASGGDKCLVRLVRDDRVARRHRRPSPRRGGCAGLGGSVHFTRSRLKQGGRPRRAGNRAGRSPPSDPTGDWCASCDRRAGRRRAGGGGRGPGLGDVREALLTDDLRRARPTPALEPAPARSQAAPRGGAVCRSTQGFIGSPPRWPPPRSAGAAPTIASLLGAALVAPGSKSGPMWTADVRGPRIVSNARRSGLPATSRPPTGRFRRQSSAPRHPAPLVAARTPASCSLVRTRAPAPPSSPASAPKPEGARRSGRFPASPALPARHVRSPTSLGTADSSRPFEVFERTRNVVDVIATSEVNVSGRWTTPHLRRPGPTWTAWAGVGLSGPAIVAWSDRAPRHQGALRGSLPVQRSTSSCLPGRLGST